MISKNTGLSQSGDKNNTFTTRLTLLQRAQTKTDSRAWKELLQVYQRYVYGIIQSMGIQGPDSDDVMQLVSLQLWKYLPQYKYNPDGAKFRSWVGRITHNQVLNYKRSRNTYQSKIDACKELEAETMPGTAIMPEVEKVIEGEWKTFITDTAFENISRHFSNKAMNAFQLQIQGKSVKEISEELEVKADSVYKYLSRIKVKLIEEVQRLREDYEF